MCLVTCSHSLTEDADLGVFTREACAYCYITINFYVSIPSHMDWCLSCHFKNHRKAKLFPQKGIASYGFLYVCVHSVSSVLSDTLARVYQIYLPTGVHKAIEFGHSAVV